MSDAGAPDGRPAGGMAAPRPVVDVHDAFCLHPLPEGAVVALRGLSLQVAPGERLLVHGPNGSGKTTLLRLLAGEQRLAAGRAVVAGFDVSLPPADVARWRRRALGWVDQRAARTLRPELDVLGNVALQLRLGGVGARAAGEVGRAWLDRLALGHLAPRRPTTLSGGEAQRVAVAAALAHGPALVLADEPSGELDLASADAVYDTLVDAVAAAGSTLVLVSHDRRAARVADRVVRIRDGRLSETWTPGGEDELLVVDDRGWLRLPDALRGAGPARAGAGDRAAGAAVMEAGAADDGTILLRPVPRSPAPAGDAPPGDVPAGVLVAGDAPPGDAPTGRASTGAAGAPASALAGPGAGAASIDGGEPLARLRVVSRSFGDRRVLHDLDLDVRAGSLHVVSGRSGSGKSTLLRVLVGLERPDAGSVRLGGVDLATLDRAGLAGARRRLVATVGQDVHLAETVPAIGNVELARAARALPTDRSGDLERLAAVGAAALADRPARVLSGGERQRVAVARALATGAPLLVLDEPTSQLDESAVELLVGVLRAAVAGGIAVLAATHDPVLVAAADTVTSLDG